jgi:hypothetical protein
LQLQLQLEEVLEEAEQPHQRLEEMAVQEAEEAAVLQVLLERLLVQEMKAVFLQVKVIMVPLGHQDGAAGEAGLLALRLDKKIVQVVPVLLIQ